MSHAKCSGSAALTNKNPCALAHGQFQISPLKNPWSVLRTATQKAALSGDKIAISSDMEGHLRLELRTPCLRGRCSNRLS